jgi:hypothetical protein
MSGLINPYTSEGGNSLLSIIQSLSLSSGLKLCLDVADPASYPGSGQVWADLSGQAVNFNRGATSTPAADDPTFNGAAGIYSANTYWSFNGSQIFTLIAGSNPSWLEPFHKNGATWSYLSILLLTASGAGGICGNTANSTAIGMFIQPNNFKNRIRVQNGVGISLEVESVAAMTTDVWAIIGGSVNENGGATAGIFMTNGTVETFNPSYTSPSASNASALLEVSGTGGAGTSGTLPIGTRLACLALWDTALSSANLSALYTASRTRFGV